MKNLLILTAGLCLLAGCTGSDSGDVEAAKAAAAAAPKSVDELPSDMPEEAKRGAAAAIEQGKAMEQQMGAQNDARAKAMAEMQRQKGGG